PAGRDTGCHEGELVVPEAAAQSPEAFFHASHWRPPAEPEDTDLVDRGGRALGGVDLVEEACAHPGRLALWRHHLRLLDLRPRHGLDRLSPGGGEPGHQARGREHDYEASSWTHVRSSFVDGPSVLGSDGGNAAVLPPRPGRRRECVT